MYNGANIEITTYIGCPLACKFCPQGSLIKSYKGDNYTGKKVMSLESYKSMLSKISKQVQIIFSGYVEPWTNPQCTQMILHTLNQGYRLSLFTTLQGLKPGDADKVLNKFRENDELLNIVCIHLPDKGMFMRGWKNKPEYFEVLDKFFSYYMEKGGLSSRLQAMTMDKYGEPHPAIVQRYGLRLGSFFGHDRAGSLDKEKNGVGEAVMVPQVKHSFKNGCSATRGSFYNHQILLPNGDIQICCMDYGLKNTLGNLIELDRWEDIFSTPEYKRIEQLSNTAEYTDELICKSCHLASRIE